MKVEFYWRLSGWSFFSPLVFQAVEGMLDCLTSMPNDPELMIRYRDIHLRVLKALQDPRAYGMQWTNKQVTRYVS
jgi:CCR4-NOT transcription complex subunit 1